MSVGLLDEGFRTSLPLRIRYDHGGWSPLAIPRWQGAARGADAGLLARAAGRTLDVGCGPGRLASALVRAGIPALGIDISPSAVRLTRLAGAPAVLSSVFEDVPDVGSWNGAVLADGNIGIGGDPVRLLQRMRELLAPRGQVLVELERPGIESTVQRIRLEADGGRTGSWFAWSLLGVDAVAGTAAAAGLTVEEVWSAADSDDEVSVTPGSAQDLMTGEHRWFAALRVA